MDWLLDFKLWENPHVYRAIKTEAERIERARHAVLAKSFSRNCVVIIVDFGGFHVQEKLPAPQAS